MKYYKITALIILSFIIVSCATSGNRGENIENQKENISALYPKTKTNIKRYNSLKLLKPTFINISPFDNKKINISVKDENFKKIITTIASILNINIIIPKDIDQIIPKENQIVTLELHQKSPREIFNILANLVGFSYETKDNLIIIKAIDQKIFDLSFLKSLRESSYELGGDVLGNTGNQEDIISPLKGRIELSDELKKENTDIYKSIEENLKKLISDKGEFIINKETGILYVKDKIPNLKEIEKFIYKIKEKYQKQILIETQIIEVNLKKSQEYGVNWQAILNNDLKDTVNIASTAGFLWENSNTFTLRFQASPYFDSILKAIEKYGTVKIISNPRIRILNTQPALIGVGKSISYIKEIQRETIASGGVTTTNTNITTSAVFDGLLFKVTPYIDENNQITLNITPIKSDVINLKQSDIDNYQITLPEVNLRETSTIIRVKNNDLVVISGLIMDKKDKQTTSVPGLGKLPIIGNLFKYKTTSREKVELIILLKASIIK